MIKIALYHYPSHEKVIVNYIVFNIGLCCQISNYAIKYKPEAIDTDSSGMILGLRKLLRTIKHRTLEGSILTFRPLNSHGFTVRHMF